MSIDASCSGRAHGDAMRCGMGIAEAAIGSNAPAGATADSLAARTSWTVDSCTIAHRAGSRPMIHHLWSSLREKIESHRHDRAASEIRSTSR